MTKHGTGGASGSKAPDEIRHDADEKAKDTVLTATKWRRRAVKSISTGHGDVHAE